jgi:hypothetical protein
VRIARRESSLLAGTANRLKRSSTPCRRLAY